MSIQLSPSGPAMLEPDVPLDRQAAFVQTLAQWGNVRAAAQQVGVSRAHLYRMRRASARFRQLWDAALVLARPQVEEVLADRALNGVQEVVYYHGEEVATRTRYDSRLLLAHLARLDRIAATAGVHATVADFDAEVERLLDPPELYDWDDEEDYGAEEYGEDGWEAEDDIEEADADGTDAHGNDGEAAEADDAPAADERAAAEEEVSAGAGPGAGPGSGGAAGGVAGGSAGGGAAGFVALDSVSCVSNSGPHPPGERAEGPGSAGPSCRLLHH